MVGPLAAIACDNIGQAGASSKQWSISYCNANDYQGQRGNILITLQLRSTQEVWLSHGGQSDTFTRDGNTWEIRTAGGQRFYAPADLKNVLEFCINDARQRGDL